jgi:drug/metabolite transporter (DMT)-like permease
MERWVYLLPLGSSLGYAMAALCLKRAVDAGVGPWRMCFLSNVALSLAFMPALLWWEPGWRLDPWWPPLVSGLLFFGGQLLTMLSLTRGDVSVATPVLGSKVVLVAFFLVVLAGESLGWRVWTAAGLTVAGIWLLQGGGLPENRARVLRTVGLAFASALCFSIADVVVQMWTRTIGFGLFVAVSSGVTLALSFFLLPKFSGPLWPLPRGANVYAGWGVAILALQALSLFIAIGVYEKAAEANVIYSARGMWSVALVWLVGHWFGNVERHAGRAVMLRRLIGSGLIVGAIGLVVSSGV